MEQLKKPMSRTICIYHDKCMDGAASAWVLREFFRGTDEVVEFIPASYGDAPPADLRGASIFILDFSYNRAQTQELMRNNTVVILDHHESAHKEIGDLVTIDQTLSGVGLAWRFFNGTNAAMPLRLLYVQDRDLWNFKLDNTKEFMAGVFQYPATLAGFSAAMEVSIERLIIEGRALLKARQNSLDTLVSNARRIYVNERDVPIVNANYEFASDLGDILSKDEPFVVIYSDIGHQRKFSLRSQKIGGVDVSVIAEEFGGGGHVNAASFTMDLGTPECAESISILNSVRYIKELNAKHWPDKKE